MEKFADGAIFVGNFKRGQPDGFGKYQSAHGSLYTGQFHKGKKHGKGKWSMPGEVKGTMKSKRVTEYEGDMVNGCI